MDETPQTDQIWHSNEFQELRDRFFEFVNFYSSQVMAVRSPQKDRIEPYFKKIEQAGLLRGMPLYYPYIGAGVGHRCLVALADGSVKYDFITGVGVHYLGHAHPRMIEAGLKAAAEDVMMQGNLHMNEASIRLMDRLLKWANRTHHRFDHCFLTSSGAMANENALKIVFQKHAPADRIMAFEHCFAGRSMVMAQITDKASLREGLPHVLNVDYIPFYDAEDPQGSLKRALRRIDELVHRYPKRHAGMMMELIQGEGGYYAGSSEFFAAVMERVKQYGLAVIVDEIQTFGRTDQPFALQHFGCEQWVDVVTVGKPLQACATLYSDQYRPRQGLISQTYTAATAAIYGGLAVLDELEEGDYFGPQGRINVLGQHFERRLRELSEKYPTWINGPFGYGLMKAFTLANGSPQLSRDFLLRLFDAGVIAFIAGEDPVRIRFLPPPGATTKEDIDAVCAIIDLTVAQHIRLQETQKSPL